MGYRAGDLGQRAGAHTLHARFLRSIPSMMTKPGETPKENRMGTGNKLVPANRVYVLQYCAVKALMSDNCNRHQNCLLVSSGKFQEHCNPQTEEVGRLN